MSLHKDFKVIGNVDLIYVYQMLIPSLFTLLKTVLDILFLDSTSRS